MYLTAVFTAGFDSVFEDYYKCASRSALAPGVTNASFCRSKVWDAKESVLLKFFVYRTSELDSLDCASFRKLQIVQHDATNVLAPLVLWTALSLQTLASLCQVGHRHFHHFQHFPSKASIEATLEE